jgi:hypothetical protein
MSHAKKFDLTLNGGVPFRPLFELAVHLDRLLCKNSNKNTAPEERQQHILGVFKT